MNVNYIFTYIYITTLVYINSAHAITHVEQYTHTPAREGPTPYGRFSMANAHWHYRIPYCRSQTFRVRPPGETK